MTGKWVLNTATTTYAVSLAPDESALLLDYFGPRAESVPAWEQPDLPPVMSTIPDYAPVEYAALGTRNVHGSELIVEFEDGARGSRFRYADHTFDEAEGETHLSVRFVDEQGLEMVQHVLVRAASDVVERWVVLRDVREAGGPIRLARAFSGAVCVQASYGVRLDYLAGAWMREHQPQSVDLRLGTFRMGSRQGVTGHLFVPMVAVSTLGPDGAPDPAAGTIGVALAWSGSWALAAEAQPNGLVRISAGLNDEGTALVLTPGREVETPHLLAVHVASGSQELSHAWHGHQRSVISRSSTPEHRPVVYNSWEATEFDLRVEHQLDLATVAAELGAEVFVLDAGWSPGRPDAGAPGGWSLDMGDWEPDTGIFPDGLPAFAEQILAKGMRFGLWIEPEAVSPDSKLYHEHPDWVYRNQGVPEILVRNQLVLDLGNPEAYAWMEQTLRDLLTNQPVTFLKWDMTRPITAPGRPGDLLALEWSFAHTRAYYRLLEMIRREFPDVTVEGCSGGSGRIDNAMLGLVDVVWASDATGPRDRLLIQDGFLSAYPSYVMSSWVTDAVGVLDRAAVSLELRFVVAMAGVLGIGADITEWTAEQRAVAKKMVRLYRELRPIIHGGTLYRHSAPTARGYALEYAGGDDHGGRIVVLAYDTARERTGPEPVSPFSITPPVRIRLASADPHTTYRLNSDGSVHDGAMLRSAGLVVPWALASDADVLVLEPVSRA